MKKILTLVLSVSVLLGVAAIAGRAGAANCDCGSGCADLGVNAGPNRDAETGEAVRLNGSVSGDYDRVRWSCNGGTLSDADSLRPTFKFFDYDDYNGRAYTCTLTAYNECGSDSDTVEISSLAENSLKSLRVALIARPKGECAPLGNIDLIATLYEYGGYDGDYTYRFDCHNDGTWDKIFTTDETSYTAVDLCDYPNAAAVTARVEVEAGHKTVTDTEIVVNRRDCGYDRGGWGSGTSLGQLGISKNVRNLSNGTGYQGTVLANPGDVLSFKIVITGNSGTVDDVTVTDILPGGITNIRNLAVDGIYRGGILSSGVNLGRVSGGQTRVITYDATVAGAYNFSLGQTMLNNVSTVAFGGISASSNAIVQVYRAAGYSSLLKDATRISTGIGGSADLGAAIGLFGALLSSLWVFRKRIGGFFSAIANRG